MAIVAVAGGFGDLGRPITDALFESEKYEIYVMSRKVAEKEPTSERISPLTGKAYRHVIRTDYSSEDSLVEQLAARQVNIIICAFSMDSDSACAAQLQLIRAADRTPCVTRFIPSEFNVEYDVGDDVLPYPEKRFHLTARRKLAQTSTLEYTYIYSGMFMDYFGLPRVASSLRPLCFCIDPDSGMAVLPGDGEARMSMSLTTDTARYLVLGLALDTWPRIMTTVTATVSMNELAQLYEKTLGRKLTVRYQPVEKLLKHESIDLPANLDIAKKYPERFPQGVRGLIADLEAGIALGGYDLSRLGDHLDLVKEFEGKAPAPRTIEDFIEEAWKPVYS